VPNRALEPTPLRDAARARLCAWPRADRPALGVQVPRPTSPEDAQGEAAHDPRASKPAPPCVAPPRAYAGTRRDDPYPRRSTCPTVVCAHAQTPSARVVATRNNVHHAYKTPASPHALARRRALAFLYRRSPLEAASRASPPEPHCYTGDFQQLRTPAQDLPCRLLPRASLPFAGVDAAAAAAALRRQARSPEPLPPQLRPLGEPRWFPSPLSHLSRPRAPSARRIPANRAAPLAHGPNCRAFILSRGQPAN
jgi:hypothetical protein